MYSALKCVCMVMLGYFHSHLLAIQYVLFLKLKMVWFQSYYNPGYKHYQHQLIGG